jgi:hypothetical protein
LKLQAGNFDPGMEALRGAAGPGERKAVTRIRFRTEDSLQRAGSVTETNGLAGRKLERARTASKRA